jgi:Nickel responsive protein SCO4226-like
MRSPAVATFLDIHDLPGVQAEDVVGAHEADVRVQAAYGVNYRHYWVDEEAGKVFCLVDAPDRETAARAHREAHGLEAHTLYEVKQGA